MAPGLPPRKAGRQNLAGPNELSSCGFERRDEKRVGGERREENRSLKLDCFESPPADAPNIIRREQGKLCITCPCYFTGEMPQGPRGFQRNPLRLRSVSLPAKRPRLDTAPLNLKEIESQNKLLVFIPLSAGRDSYFSPGHLYFPPSSMAIFPF